MATQTDILKLRIPSPDGSDPADLAEIIGNLGEDVDAAVGNPAMTTTQINALTGDEKKAGRRVWDTTLGVEKVSDGTSWVTIRPLDSAGHLPMGGKRITGLADATAATDAATKAQVDAVASTSNAALPSSYVKAGVGSAMLSSETIEVTVTLGTSPTGRWSVVAVPTGWAGRVRVVSVTATTATIHIYDTAWTPGPTPATPQPLCFWQAIAY